MKLDTFLTAVLATCALFTTGLATYRAFVVQTHHVDPTQHEQPVFIDDWKAQAHKGVRFGSSDAPVQLMEFADFECPFCASYHKSLKALRNRYPSQVAITFLHYPLSMHRFAEQAARVAECAGEQGRFEAMHDRLFEQQAKFGLKPWSEFANEADVPNLTLFETCIQGAAPMRRIEEGKVLADKIGVQGTPTLLVNGWKLGRPPSDEELDRMVKAVLAGKDPV